MQLTAQIVVQACDTNRSDTVIDTEASALEADSEGSVNDKQMLQGYPQAAL
jgi:hypothetical protein